MFPGQSGKIVARFMSTRTRAAALSGTSIRNAFSVAQTAKSCAVQPSSWRTIAAAAGIGRFSTSRPCLAVRSAFRIGPTSSIGTRLR